MIDIEQRMASFPFLLVGRVNTNQERVRVFLYVSLGIGAYEKVKMHKKVQEHPVFSLFLYFSLPRNFYSCEIFKRVKFFREKISLSEKNSRIYHF